MTGITQQHFSVQIDVDGQLRNFDVYRHPASDPRFDVAVTSPDGEKVSFSLVRTPIGQWVTGSTKLPEWISRNAYSIARHIANQVL